MHSATVVNDFDYEISHTNQFQSLHIYHSLIHTSQYQCSVSVDDFYNKSVICIDSYIVIMEVLDKSISHFFPHV